MHNQYYFLRPILLAVESQMTETFSNFSFSIFSIVQKLFVLCPFLTYNLDWASKRNLFGLHRTPLALLNCSLCIFWSICFLQHSKINFVSVRGHIISYISYIYSLHIDSKTLHGAGASGIWIDQSGFNRREKLHCPSVNVWKRIEIRQFFSLKMTSNIHEKDLQS